ncbi:MAG: choice-of-anchor A family protein [Desulfovibrio sp.]|nr:choice-of-anchor A family protein [Desulfovibrio sp.]
MYQTIRTLLISAALLALSIPALAGTYGLGVAGDFNTFVFNDFQGSSDTEGRLAVGGNARLDHYSVGDKLPAGSGDVLVVGGDLTYTGGRVYNGDIRVGGAANLPGYDLTHEGETHVGAGLPFSFAAEEARLKALSQTLAQTGATGSSTFQWGTITLAGNGSATQVFNLDGQQLLDANNIAFTGIADGAIVVINVSGTQAGLANMGMQGFEGIRENVVFNFHEATNLLISGVGVQGSILAPLAHVDAQGGVIWGTTVASSWDGPTQQGHAPFEGDLPHNAVPIPGAVWLLGSALAGLVGMQRMRRQ